MHITGIQWQTYSIPFVREFQTAHGVLKSREGMIMQVLTDAGITGIGEIAPLPMFAGGSLTGAASLLKAMHGHLYHATLSEALEILALQRVSPETTSTLCGLEIALLDAIGKVEDCTVSRLLSPPGFVPRATVPVNAVVSAKEIHTAVEAALTAKLNGYRSIKLKVGLGLSVQEEIERIEAVWAVTDPSTHLRLDANEAWQLGEAIAILAKCTQFAIQYVEQPLKAQDLVGMRILRQEVPIPIAVDEAVHDLESVDRILDTEAADMLVIKPQLAGGLRIAQQMIQRASERGVSCVITSTLEAGIGIAAELHLAAATPAVTLGCGLATLPLLADDLLAEELHIQDGFMKVPTSPGLGVKLDQQTSSRQWIAC